MMVTRAEMEAHFEERTRRHIALVQGFGAKLGQDAFRKHLLGHDESKFRAPEREAYIDITWKYRCEGEGVQFTGAVTTDDEQRAATVHHVITNPHHPEYWSGRCDFGLINAGDRDSAPDEVVDVSREDIPLVYLWEMVADWCAVSEERGGSPLKWANSNIGRRWRFSPWQVREIYRAIGIFWG